MKKILLLFVSFLFVQFSFSQLYDPGIDSLINEVSQDSLMSYVRILSGEDSVAINGQKVKIEQRVYDSNDLAAGYIFEKLTSFGLNPMKLDYDVDGTNVVAVQYGTEFPNEFYFICAHYDGVTYYCADDNASGTATVLEAARILSNVEFPYSIVYALWDEEEIGLLGSHNYAKEAKAMGMDIGGVVNIDMIGYDSDDDGLVEIHSNMNTSSAAIANVMQNINSEYNLTMDVVVQSPGTGASDHSSFWEYGYGAVLLIEGYWSDDFNPFYHSVNDRVDKFNEEYFHSAAQMAIGSTAELATQDQYVSVSQESAFASNITLKTFPNPFNQKATLQYWLPEKANVQIDIVNHFGQVSQSLCKGWENKGKHSVKLDATNLADGIYSIVLRSDLGIVTTKVIKLD